ncbi:hypothetical protein RHO99_18360 [Salmonella enterica subsp. enterica serovar Typhimurium]|nr:hypothetical protein [Salmonella enterica subsp. enterica serovar Typhimurium]MDR5309711.1 hypothetical protein [Salmonella enterica subsp. enterica serovar Typhimurium]
MAIPSFLNFLEESKQLDEAFNSSPYELTFGKKNAGDIFFTFVDEDEKEFRIQFYTPQGLGKNVRQVFIGQKRGSTYPDAIGRFKNPMRVIASMIEATKQFMATPLGKTIDGFAINFSKKALERGVTLLPKIIRQSGLKQKLNVMDLTYTPIPDRAFVWVVRKGKDPAQVFDGPKMKGVTWDDPDKVGDVPVQNDTPDVGTSSSYNSSEVEVNRDWYNSSDTSLELKNGRDPIRGNYVRLVSGSREVATFYGYNFDKYLDGTEVSWSMKRGFTNQDLIGADMSKQKKGLYDQYTFKKGGQIVLVVDVDTSNSDSTNPDYEDKGQWKYDNRNQRGKQPQMVYSITKGRNTYSAMLSAHSSEPGTYVLHGSDGKSFRGPSADLIIGQARLPSPPIDMYNQFTRDSKEFWAQIDITEGVKVPSNGKVITKTKSTFTIRWDMGFPPSGLYAGAVLETTVLRVRENDYVISNIASTKNKTLNDLKSYDYRGDINSLLKEEGERYSLANTQLSTLTSISYNPNKLGYDLVSVGSYGEVRFNGQDIGLPSNRQVVINAVMKMNNEYEKTGGGKKTGVDLATYAGSIRDNAPKGRDLDWQIYASRDGQTLNVDWDITFRRNTTEGAYREFKAQIDRANQYLQTLYQDAKSKGYNPTEPNLMTLARAQQSDQWSQDNGESAYSEYEQSLGGNMQIKI